MAASTPKRITSGSGTTGLSGYPLRFWWLGGSALAVIVGSLGPWEKTELFGTTLGSTSGVERSGWIALVAGIAALAASVSVARTSTWPRPLWQVAMCATAAVLGAGVAVYEWAEIESSDDSFGAYQSASWGLYLTWAASVSLFLAAAVTLGKDTQVQAMSAELAMSHRRFAAALRWTGVVLLGGDVVLLVVLGNGMIETGPETETLGQGFIGAVLITGAILLALLALLGWWLPRLAGTLLMFVGLPLFLAVYADVQDCDEKCWSTYWVYTDRKDELSSLASALVGSRLLSLMLFLIPPIAGLVVFLAGFVRQRDSTAAPSNQAGVSGTTTPAR